MVKGIECGYFGPSTSKQKYGYKIADLSFITTDNPLKLHCIEVGTKETLEMRRIILDNGQAHTSLNGSILEKLFQIIQYKQSSAVQLLLFQITMSGS